MATENVVLLPGMMCDARLWQHQIDAIETRDTRVSVPCMTGADNVVDLAAAILQNAPPTFALAGLSMGGIVAFELWRQAPQRISHMALIDTNPYAETVEKQSLRLKQIEQVLCGGLRELAIDSLKPLYLAEVNRTNDRLLDTILDMAMDLGAEAFQQQSLLLKNRPDSTPTLPTVNCPVSVICGREDTLCPVSYHEYMASHISGAKLQILENCGHLPSMEQPEILTQALVRLFGRDAKTGKTYASKS